MSKTIEVLIHMTDKPGTKRIIEPLEDGMGELVR